MFNCILNLDYHIIDLVELAIYIDLAELVRRCNLSVQRERERESYISQPQSLGGWSKGARLSSPLFPLRMCTSLSLVEKLGYGGV
jgi:hypothetical protein